MSRWEDLGNEFERRTSDLFAAADEHKRQEHYSAWARGAVHRCIDELLVIVQHHTANFPDVVRNELCVEVEEPTTTHTEQRVLCIKFAADSVHLHAQWKVGAPPSLHVLLSRKRAGRDARLITLPGGWLRPVSTATLSIGLISENTPADPAQLLGIAGGTHATRLQGGVPPWMGAEGVLTYQPVRCEPVLANPAHLSGLCGRAIDETNGKTAVGFQLCSFDSSSHEVSLDEIAYRALRLLAAGI